MIEALEFIKQTIELNGELLSSSEEDTNEMVVVDLLNALGYDRKRSRNLIKLRGQEADWKLITQDGYMIMRVVNYGGDLLGEQAENMKPSDIIGSGECTGDDFIGLISTDGDRLVMHTYRFPTEAIVDLKITSIDEQGLEVLEAIKSDKFVKAYVNGLEDFADDSLIKKLIANKDPDMLSDNIIDAFGAERVFHAIEDYYTEAANLAIKTEENPAEVVIQEVEKPIPDGMELVDSVELARIKTENHEVETLRKRVEELSKSKEEAHDSDIVSLRNLVASLDSKVIEKDSIIRSYEKSSQLDKAEIAKYKEDVESLRRQLQAESETPQQSFVGQIEELTLKISQLEDVIKAKDTEIGNLQNKLDNIVDPRITEAQSILDAIEDTEDIPRSYVGIVNGNMYQCESMEKFIGHSLQELYSIVTFELMPYLFDGDIFRITDKAVNKDLVIGNKAYDIQLGDMSEDECINRLKTLFSKFPTVVFLSKTIGRLEVAEDIISETPNLDENVFEDSEPEVFIDNDGNEVFDEDFQVDSGDTFENTDDGPGLDFGVDFGESSELTNSEESSELDKTDTDDTDEMQDSDEIISDIVVGDTEYDGNMTEDSDTTPAYRMDGSVCFALCDLGNILWNRDIVIDKPEFIYYPERTLIIDSTNLETSLYSIVSALVVYSSNSFNSIKKVNEFNWVEVSQLINTEGKGINIPYTKYCIDASEFGHLLPVLNTVCSIIDVSTEDTYIYFKGSILSSEFEGNFVDTSDFNFQSTGLPEIDTSNSEDQHCIISGTLMDVHELGDIEYNILSNLVNRCLAVKTRYMTATLKSQEDLEYAITEILVNYDGDLSEITDELGNCPGEDYKVISRDSNEVSKNYYSVQINGDDYYVSELKHWQIVCVLLTMHKIAVDDNVISLRVTLNKDLYEAYMNQYIEYNPVKAVTIKSLMDYMSERLK